MKQEKPWFGETVDGLVSDLTQAFPRTKSEARSRILSLVAEAERRGREKAFEEVRKAAFKTVAPGLMTLDGEGGTKSVYIMAVPKSFFES